MIKYTNFKAWILENYKYSAKTVSNICSRVKRANLLLPIKNEPVYLFNLEQQYDFSKLSSSIKSQIKKAIKLYFAFLNSDKEKTKKHKTTSQDFRILSLFANIGVAEAFLEKSGFDVAVANELIPSRAKLYSRIYPHTKMICGDITKDEIYNKIISTSISKNVNVVMATPPCQGMSTVGKLDKNDIRNTLIYDVIKAIKTIKPSYGFIENVPSFLSTSIFVNDEVVSIDKLIERELGQDYIIHQYIANCKNYSVPQTRERTIVLLTARGKNIKEWILPEKDKKVVTMFDAIGKLPTIDPFVTDLTDEQRAKLFPHFEERKEEALKVSKWNNPPYHIYRQVITMQHTPTGKTAFDNKVYFPKKANGTAVKGYRNTYKRQNWDTPAYTVTMDNRKISSQNNVHPGRPDYIDSNGEQIYSDARTLTLYEIMRIMSIPTDWNIPLSTSEAFLRRVIGEGIPPLFVKKIFCNLKEDKKIE